MKYEYSAKNDPTAYFNGARVIRPVDTKPISAEAVYARGHSHRMLMLRVAFIVGLLLLIAGLVGVLGGTEVKTFGSFLEMLQTFPSVSTDWLSYVQISLELPTWLDWLQPFIEFVNGTVSVLGFFITGIIQAIGFVLHFLQWVFM